jgi:NinB protein
LIARDKSQMPITIHLTTEENRRRAIRIIELAVPGVRVTFRDPGATESQLRLLGVLLDDIIAQSYRALPMTPREWERLMTAKLAGDQGLPDYEDNRLVVRGVQFEELSISEASDLIEFTYAYGARNDINFREKKKP